MVDLTKAWENKYKRGLLGDDIEPDSTLVQYAFLVPKGKVMDIGAGEGRNALFFSKLGYEVHGIDISSTAVEKCMKKAEQDNLSLNIGVSNIFDYKIEPESYVLIIASEFLHTLKKSESMTIIPRLKEGIKKNGLIYVSAFSTDDSNYERNKALLTEVEENTFYIKEHGHYIHYFHKKEILAHFSEWRLIHCSETQYLDLGHSQTGPHYHWVITYLGQKI
jgi:2-polyprenyl-3-methyl-5-hydroxy-6-metoxy-1,4-benzoquinol methylase